MAQESRPEKIAFARELRKESTPIEMRLWRVLRANQLGQFKFRRQHPIGQFIVDFCCEEARLIVEIDGDSHVEQQTYDEARTEKLTKLGYKVVRYANRDVLNNLESVSEAILKACEMRRA